MAHIDRHLARPSGSLAHHGAVLPTTIAVFWPDAWETRDMWFFLTWFVDRILGKYYDLFRMRDAHAYIYYVCANNVPINSTPGIIQKHLLQRNTNFPSRGPVISIQGSPKFARMGILSRIDILWSLEDICSNKISYVPCRTHAWSCMQESMMMNISETRSFPIHMQLSQLTTIGFRIYLRSF